MPRLQYNYSYYKHKKKNLEIHGIANQLTLTQINIDGKTQREEQGRKKVTIHHTKK